MPDEQFQYTTVQVNGQPAKWYDNALAVEPAKWLHKLLHQQQAATEHILSWTQGGLQYTLTDYSGLPRAEMVKIADSLK